MRICENGIYRDATEEEMTVLRQGEPVPPYKERVISRIRGRYSADDEIALLRQRDTKPEEFVQYNAFVEQIKEEERARDE
jgi:hypothetical protein